jgi:hypothetical protein
MRFNRGDRVVYTPYKGCPMSQLERGIVKRMCDDGEHAFVLYHTSAMTYTESDLDNYTAARTSLSDLSRDCPCGSLALFQKRLECEALEAELESLRRLADDLADWDTKNPRGRTYSYASFKDIEGALDAICDRAKQIRGQKP